MAEQAKREEYLVLRREVVASALPSPHSTEADALGEALLKVRSDREPRVIVQLIAEVRPDPEPAVVVTRFRDEAGSAHDNVVEIPAREVAHA